MASLQHPVAIVGIYTPSSAHEASSSTKSNAAAACFKSNCKLNQGGSGSYPAIELPKRETEKNQFRVQYRPVEPVLTSPTHLVQLVVPALQLRQNVAARASKCPFGFQSPSRKEGKDSSSTEAASAATQSPPLVSTPYAPAPSSSPEARNIGPGTFEYLPLKVPYKMTMGLEPMHPDDWIEVDIFYDEEMALRRDVLATRKEVAVATHPAYPQAMEANWEVLELLVAFLPKRFPTRFAADGGTIIHNLSTGEIFDISDRSLDPLDVSSRLVQEDLCLLMKVDGELRFVSGAVLFPQRWQLLEKLGMDMRDIHLPVPLYEEEIGPKVAAFMDRLKVSKPVWRANWAIVDDPTLFQPMNEEDIYAALQGQIRELDDPITVSTAGTRLFTRCERETLMRLPRTGAILFTIRTYIKPLSVFESRPALAAQMVQALKALPEPIFKYKTMAGFYELAFEYLQNCAELQT